MIYNMTVFSEKKFSLPTSYDVITFCINLMTYNLSMLGKIIFVVNVNYDIISI